MAKRKTQVPNEQEFGVNTLLEGIKSIFPDAERQRLEVEKIILAIANTNPSHDATVLAWTKVHNSYLNELSTYARIASLRILYWGLPQFSEVKEEKSNNSINVFVLPQTKKWILEQVVALRPLTDILEFLGAVYNPDPYSLDVQKRAVYETDDDIAARGRWGNSEERKLVEQALRQRLEKESDWRPIECAMKAVRVPQHKELYEILAHAWIRLGAAKRLEQVLHNDNGFHYPSDHRFSDEALELICKYTMKAQELDRQVKSLENALRNDIAKHTSAIPKMTFSYKDLNIISLRVEFDNTDKANDLFLVCGNLIKAWQTGTEGSYKKRIAMYFEFLNGGVFYEHLYQ